MGELEDSFGLLLGRQPSAKEKQELYRVRDALKLKATDAVWLLLMALQHYQTLYEEFPARIAGAAQEVTQAVRSAAEAQAKAAHAETKRALMDAVQHAAVVSAKKAARGQGAKWASTGGGIVLIALVVVGWGAFSRGEGKGEAVGASAARRDCAAAEAGVAWLRTPEGHLAFDFARVGSLTVVARCLGRGFVPKDGWCWVQPERGKPLRWRLPPEDGAR